jgi:hypothetical protein
MIFSRHSVLKRGCSTWDRQQMPQEEYQARLASLRQQMAQQGLDALVTTIPMPISVTSQTTFQRFGAASVSSRAAGQYRSC